MGYLRAAIKTDIDEIRKMKQPDNWGWKARIGMFIVGVEAVPEAEWWAMLPSGISDLLANLRNQAYKMPPSQLKVVLERSWGKNFIREWKSVETSCKSFFHYGFPS